MRHFLWGVVVPDLWLPDPVPGVVFVFGSNKAGRHGKGAALTAAKHYGARPGYGESLWGKSYAIPTKDEYLRPVSAEVLSYWVSVFQDCAKHAPEILFLVTRIGCGLAENKDSEIAPMFAHAPANCILPGEWIQYLPTLAHSLRVWHEREPGKVFAKERDSYTVTGPYDRIDHYTEDRLQRLLAERQD